tara:strand:+ start:208 stop:384 length:177 start_codon:yes stop_codon:yes gene_type:complete
MVAVELVVLIVRQEILVDQVEGTPIQVALRQVPQVEPNQAMLNLEFLQDIVNTVTMVV